MEVQLEGRYNGDKFREDCAQGGFMKVKVWPVLVVLAALSSAAQAENRPEVLNPPSFNEGGAIAGSAVPDAWVVGLDGARARLSSIWKEGPTLLVASSLTCPISRDNSAALDRIARALDGRLTVLVVYTLEAHPKGAPSPYALDGGEWITDRNVEEGFIYPAASTIADRIAHAKIYKSLQKTTTGVVVDDLKDLVWASLGGGPNSAALIDVQGKVVHRQGWFAPHAMSLAAHSHLNARTRAALAPKMAEAGLQDWDLTWVFRGDEVDKARVLLDKLPELIRYPGIPHGRSQPGHTPLHSAAERAPLAMIDLLLSRGADPGALDDRGTTPLHIAAERGDVEIFKRFMKKNPDVAALSGDHRSPLHLAVFNGHAPIVAALREAGAPEDLFTAAGLGDLEQVERILQATPDRLKATHGRALTALDYAAAGGSVEVAALLIARGADPRGGPADEGGMPPLYHAARGGHAEIVELLIKRGVSPRTRLEDYEGTALHVAARHGRVAVAAALLRRGMDVDALDQDHTTALHAAATFGQLEVARLLIERGARVNVRAGIRAVRPCDSFGMLGPDGEPIPERFTPLHAAAEAGHIEVVEHLLSKGADPRLLDANGKTPLDLARDNKRLAVVERLERR